MLISDSKALNIHLSDDVTLVLKDGICDEKTKKRREMRAKRMKDVDNSNNRSNWRDLSTEVTLEGGCKGPTSTSCTGLTSGLKKGNPWA
jgi:hypothetical protein